MIRPLCTEVYEGLFFISTLCEKIVTHSDKSKKIK